MIYVLSDIHGNRRRFQSVMEQIDLQPEDMLYILGDVVDRHPAGICLLRQIMGMPNAKMILGNHEYMMLRALGHPRDENHDDGRATEHWYRNGGKVTHEHFNSLDEKEQREIIGYLRKLPLELDVEVNSIAYKLVHAAPAAAYDGDPVYKTPTHFAVWKRLDPKDILPGEYTLVFGHTPTKYIYEHAPMAVWYGDRRIGIDCGCGFPEEGPQCHYGRLACLRLDDGAVFYSREGETQ